MSLVGEDGDPGRLAVANRAAVHAGGRERRGDPAGAIERDETDLGAQRGDLRQMIWNVSEIVAQLSRLYTLEPGDLIMTGTPAGVGPVRPGDRVEASIEGLSPLVVTIVEAED